MSQKGTSFHSLLIVNDINKFPNIEHFVFFLKINHSWAMAIILSVYCWILSTNQPIFYLGCLLNIQKRCYKLCVCVCTCVHAYVQS